MPEAELAGVFTDIREQALRWVAEESMPGTPVVALGADMRYAGQSHEIPVDLASDIGPGLTERVHDAFADAYQAVYGSADRQARVELVNARAHVIVPTPKPSPRSPQPRVAGAPSQREVLHAGHWMKAEVWARGGLEWGRRLDGPLVITQYDTTTFVPPGAWVEVDGAGNLIGGFA